MPEKLFRMYLISVLYITMQIKHCISEENTAENESPISVEKCVNNICSCEDFQKLTKQNVLCYNKNDSMFVSWCERYLNNCIYSLEYTGIENIPARVFQGLAIYDLIVDGSDLTVDRNVFEEMVALKSFRVAQSRIQIIPNFWFVKDSIEHIAIDSSGLRSLEGKYLQNLTKVQSLSFVNNTISFLDPDFFKGRESVERLDLSHNLLTFIPEMLLDPMKNLSFFKANNNNLLNVDNLFSVTLPKEIYLNNNNIADISSVLKLNRKYYEENLTNFEHELLFNCAETRRIWFPKPDIKTLSFSDNSINETTKPIFPCYIFSKDVKDGFGPMFFTYYVETLVIAGNQLNNLGSLVKFLISSNLKVSRNKIQYISAKDFVYTHMNNLDLQENEIRRIDQFTFISQSNRLISLNLSYNLITSLNGSVRYLEKLTLLDLTHNSIQYFQEDEFLKVYDLHELHLGYNKIKTLDQLQLRQFDGLYPLSLMVHENLIEEINVEELPTTLYNITLSGNPFKCNCRFHELHLHLMDRHSDVYKICRPPALVVNEHKKSNCPKMCSCKCTKHENVSFISVDCSSKELSDIPWALKNNITELEITYHLDYDVYPPYNLKDIALGIHLENNNVEYIEAEQFPPNLIQLYLSNNRLKRLPESIFKDQQNLKQVTLSGNPWKCDCSTSTFMEWLISNNDTVQDIGNIRCGKSEEKPAHLDEKAIWNLTEEELCRIDRAFLIPLTFGALTFLIICLVARVLYTKYELNIKLFLYSHGFTHVKEEELCVDKMFDAFVAFSHNDDEFVIKEIISVIESKDPNIHLCLHYRHFIPGEFILKNIIQAVENSKRTVVILSRNFIESEWCLLEFKIALTQAMEDKTHRIIVIKIGDLPKDMDHSIKTYLQTTTYLNWEEKNFWQKLLFILPSGSSHRNFVPRNTGENEDVFSFSACDL